MSHTQISGSVNVKTCKECGASLPLTDFYVYKTGYSAGMTTPTCKGCQRARARKWRYEHHERALAKMAARRKTPEYLAKNHADHRKSVARHPEKQAARKLLNNAIKRGDITRQPCVACGKPNAHGHHHDYSRPFDVEWLCVRCHAKTHRTTPEGLAAR